MAKLRDVLFISVQGNGDVSWLVANEKAEDAIEEDGPTIVATYKLVSKRTLVKAAHEVPMKGSKRK